MKTAHDFQLVLVTAPNRAAARRLARAALQQRLAACVNLVPGVESHYWWQGKIESAAEVLLLFKTRKTLVRRLQSLVGEQHPYDTPEFLAVPLRAGSRKYLKWLAQETKGARKGKGNGK